MHFVKTPHTFDLADRRNRLNNAVRSPRRIRRNATELPIRLGTIVVPLDGSTFAEHALPLALSIARRTGAMLRLVHAYIPFSPLFARPGAGLLRTIERQLREESLSYLRSVSERLRHAAPEVSVMTQFVETKDVADSLRSIAEKGDFVVMTSRRRGWLSRLLSRSFAHHIMTKVSRPVLLVRGSDTPVEFTDDYRPRHVIVPLDGEKPSEKILAPAEAVARIFWAEATMLHVDEPDMLDARFPHSIAAEYLGHMSRKWRDTLPGSESHVVRNCPNVARGILDFVSASDGAMIALTLRTRKWLKFPRVAERVIRSSPGPVLVIRE